MTVQLCQVFPGWRSFNCPVILLQPAQITLPQSQLERVVNVQHYCTYQCELALEQTVQERQLTDVEQEIVRHHADNLFVLNVYALGMPSVSLHYLKFGEPSAVDVRAACVLGARLVEAKRTAAAARLTQSTAAQREVHRKRNARSSRRDWHMKKRSVTINTGARHRSNRV